MGDEKLFFFPGSGNRKLLGFVHLPPRRSEFALLYCHPFAEEKNFSHSIVVRTARAICAAGIPVMRFDLGGCGDSEGELTDVRVEDWVEDIGHAAAVLRRETGLSRIGIWGLRAGAALGVMYGGQDPQVDFYVLWQPVADLKIFMNQFLRQRISTLMVAGGGETVSVKSTVKEIEESGIVEVMGYPVNKSLLDSFGKAGRRIPEGIAHPAFLASIGPSDQPGEAMLTLEGKLKERGLAVRLVHAQDTTFWDHLWRWESPDLTRETVEWLKSYV